MALKPLTLKRCYREDTIVAALVFAGLTYATFFVLRYGGLWAEGDTSAFSRTVTQVLSVGSIMSGVDYAHGFGYPAWLGTLTTLGGFPTPVMNTVVAPFLGTLWMVVWGYLAFRELTGSSRIAGIGVLLLLAVPDVMFTVLRGNHEKLNITLMLAAIYMLVKSIRLGAQQATARSILPWLAAFYLATFANASTNDYFGTAFAAALTLIAAIFWLLQRGEPYTADRDRYARIARHLWLAALGAWALAWLFMLYVYPPAAASDVPLLRSAAKRVTSLFLTFHTTGNPYMAASQVWENSAVFNLLASFRWVLLAASLSLWIQRVWTVRIRRERVEWQDLFLIAVYAAFSALVAIAIPVDWVGLSAGNNLEVRNFTYFALFAAPLTAWGLSRLAASWVASRRSVRKGRRIMAGIITAVTAFTLAGTAKADLDPTIANLWLFYRPAEFQAIRSFWWHSQGQVLWAGPDDRLPEVAHSWLIRNPGGNLVQGYAVMPAARDFLVSPVVLASLRADGETGPWTTLTGLDRIYDDGGAQIYRTVATTAFEH
jgi:hypothetical protein